MPGSILLHGRCIYPINCHSVHVYRRTRTRNQRRQLQPVATFSQVRCYKDLFGSPVTLQYGTGIKEMSAGSLLMSILMSGKCGILLKRDLNTSKTLWGDGAEWDVTGLRSLLQQPVHGAAELSEHRGEEGAPRQDAVGRFTQQSRLHFTQPHTHSCGVKVRRVLF